MEENTQGNPKALEDSVFGSDADNFFEQLETNVNGSIQDNVEDVQKETPASQDPAYIEQPQTQVSQPSEIDNIKKRYSDSSREAQRLKAQLNELQPFMPVLNAMKTDSNLVSHVRNYFQEGGNVPKNVKSELKLSEDFVFDPEEMVNDEKSDSRKVFDSMVGKIVNERANEIVGNIEQENYQKAYQTQLSNHAKDFMHRNGLTGEEFASFVNEAQERFSTKGMTFDDMYLIMNSGKVNQKVADNTKKDMLGQMKNVRNIPTSTSSVNNAGQGQSNVNDSVFDSLLGSDENIEELLG